MPTSAGETDVLGTHSRIQAQPAIRRRSTSRPSTRRSIGRRPRQSDFAFIASEGCARWHIALTSLTRCSRACGRTRRTACCRRSGQARSGTRRRQFAVACWKAIEREEHVVALMRRALPRALKVVGNCLASIFPLHCVCNGAFASSTLAGTMYSAQLLPAHVQQSRDHRMPRRLSA